MAKHRKSPPQIRVAEETYKATVLLIHSKVEGVPKLLSLLRDDQTIDLAGGEEFLIAYVPAHMLEKK